MIFSVEYEAAEVAKLSLELDVIRKLRLQLIDEEDNEKFKE